MYTALKREENSVNTNSLNKNEKCLALRQYIFTSVNSRLDLNFV